MLQGFWTIFSLGAPEGENWPGRVESANLTQRRREQNRQNIEREIVREQNRSKELKQQNTQHREEPSKLLQELKVYTQYSLVVEFHVLFSNNHYYIFRSDLHQKGLV